VHEDGVISHDTSPLPPPAANIERYLVDLLQFRCPGNFSDKGAPKDDVIRQRVDLGLLKLWEITVIPIFR
jgi:hypothetical protein